MSEKVATRKILVAKMQMLKGDRSHHGRFALFVLGLFLLFAMITGFINGSAQVSLFQLIRDLQTKPFEILKTTDNFIILMEIRAPRIILGLLVGASLAVSGALMQGLFRNPLADPGIMGVTSGASLGAIIYIVLGALLPSGIFVFFGSYGLFFCSFLGGLFVSFLLYTIATRQGRTSIATMLLAGIAIAALIGAIIGIVISIANDNQLRDFTFWSLGSLVGATWKSIGIAMPIILICLIISFCLSSALNALSLGEAVANHLGFSVQKSKNYTLIVVSLMCGTATALSGGIGFVGIVVPHLLRLTIGPDHKYLLPCAALLGASLLILADTFARFIVAPAELSIGIVTALFGAPFFLWILLRQRGVLDL